MSTELALLEKVIKERTPGPWFVTDRMGIHAVGTGDIPYNGYPDINFIAAMGTHAELIWDVIKATDDFEKSFGVHIGNISAKYVLQKMQLMENVSNALIALKEALKHG